MANTLPGTPYVESSDLVANYPAVSESLAERVDLVGILPFATSTARGTALPTPTDGQFSYLQDSNSTQFWNGSAWQALSSGKILQVVRATDTTNRTTTSTTFVDVTGMTVTITPQLNTSAIMLIATGYIASTTANNNGNSTGQFRITDSSNNLISGGGDHYLGTNNYTSTGTSSFNAILNIIGWATPATTSAVTYKLRFLSGQAQNTVGIYNGIATGQMYAIEVAA